MELLGLKGERMPEDYRSQVFKSKIDTWFAVLMVGSSAICLVASYFVLVSGESILARTLIVSLLIISSVWMIWSLINTNYRITQGALILWCGPIRSRVQINNIQEIGPSRNIASGPACSIDRLYIRFKGNKGGVLVSPKDRDGFVNAIASSDQDIEVRGKSAYRMKN